jgi:KaiC/GvpD/RAD55 family RecA-like ATPase
VARVRPREHTGDGPGEVTIQHDVVSEGLLIAAAMEDEKARALVLRRIEPDHLFESKHREILIVMKELDRRKLTFDIATLQKLGNIDADYARLLCETHRGASANVAFHIERVLWDAARLNAIQGPVASLVDAIKDPLTDPDRVRTLARQVGGSFDGYQDRKYLRDPAEVIREMMNDVRATRAGLVSYSYGVDRLDYFERREFDKIVPERRMIPGAKPGQITCITGVPGIGKSTITARIALGLARNRRKILYGAWEMEGNVTLKLLACMSLGYKRSRLIKKEEDGGLTEEELFVLEQRAHSISKYVRFLEVPFDRARGEKRTRDSNDRNLDVLQGYIADTGCDVFIADLWKRCLRNTEPDDEEHALNRQQAMAKELKIHCILVQQQRSKDVEQRVNKRPTRDGIKGSGAWIEVPDTILGIHRPGAYKEIGDDTLEIDVLKQRYGVWPMAIEFEWDKDTGLIAGGKTVPYVSGDDDGGDSGGGESINGFLGSSKKRRR